MVVLALGLARLPPEDRAGTTGLGPYYLTSRAGRKLACVPPLYDADALKYSSPGEDLKWSAAAFGIAAFVALIIGLALSALL